MLESMKMMIPIESTLERSLKKVKDSNDDIVNEGDSIIFLM